MIDSFKALISSEKNGLFSQGVGSKSPSELPDHEVLIKVEYAGLNFKDALSAFGNKGVTRKYPHTPGVDAAGTIVSDVTKTFQSGQKVLCTSFDLGMNTSGGFGQYIRVPSNWVIPLPEHISTKESMILGTAAYTAGLALYKMEKNDQAPELGPIAVSGASGGVGSMAIAILHKAGYKTIASTGSSENHEFLKTIGATEIVDRSFFDDQSGRPLLSPKWGGAIDNVGGNTLATLIKACGRNGNVASIGLVASADLQTTVFPFILNGVNLLGIDSAETPLELRRKIWSLVFDKWRPEQLTEMTTEISFDELVSSLDKLRKGQTLGRYVLNLWN